MTSRLQTLGRIAFQYPWTFLAGWLVLLAILSASAFHFFEPTSSSISIPGTEAQKAIDRAEAIAADAGGSTGRVVFQAREGKTINDLKDEITSFTGKVGEVDGVSRAVSPFIDTSFVSKSGTIAYAQIQLKKPIGSVEMETIDSIDSLIASARSDELQIEKGGALINNNPENILGIGEVGGVIIALVVLFMTLGSLIAAGMPIVIALLGIGVSMAGLFSLSRVFEINSTTPVLAVMLGLAVGIDYSLFIINKYRFYALQGIGMKEAAAKAVGTAGNAVIFAALTVVIALAALTVVNIPFMTTMGLVGAASIAIAALVAVSLVPALLGIAGKYVFPSKNRSALGAKSSKKPANNPHISHASFWYKWGEAVTKYRIPVLLGSVLLIGLIALPAKDLTLGLPTDQYAAADSTERRAYDLLTKGFGVGFNGPLTVVVEGLPAVSDAERNAVRQKAMQEFNQQVAAQTAAQQAAFQQKMMQASTIEQQLALQQEIAAAQVKGEAQKQKALAEIESSVAQFAKLVQLSIVAESISKLPNVDQALPAVANEEGTAGIIQVIPSSAPSHQATTDLIAALRDTSKHDEITKSEGATLAVTGSTALQEDINKKLADALPLYLAVVVGLSLILLVIAFRSILVPIKATLGFLLSVLAMFGALVAVFQWGWFDIATAPGPIVSFIPIIAIGILFGLAMDYEFFLVSGMHESYVRTKNARKAVVDGFGMGSKVVTAAGIIMVSVFAGFVFNHDTTIQAVGFGLAIGILIDAFVVRMTIVPAVMSLLGKRAWWLPKWLDNLLPHVSIEGKTTD